MHGLTLVSLVAHCSLWLQPGGRTTGECSEARGLERFPAACVHWGRAGAGPRGWRAYPQLPALMGTAAEDEFLKGTPRPVAPPMLLLRSPPLLGLTTPGPGGPTAPGLGAADDAVPRGPA